MQEAVYTSQGQTSTTAISSLMIQGLGVALCATQTHELRRQHKATASGLQCADPAGDKRLTQVAL